VSEILPLILIAEDNPCLARVLSFKFRASGYSVVVCADGQEAWVAFESNPVAAIVSDHEMPVLSGVDLFRRVRAVDKSIPLFMVTGRQLELPPGIDEELDMTKVFGKPFSPGAVITAVDDAINKSSTRC
jgi:CheY-like chemotaxis protein